jgi:acetoin utilization protein AcuB
LGEVGGLGTKQPASCHVYFQLTTPSDTHLPDDPHKIRRRFATIRSWKGKKHMGGKQMLVKQWMTRDVITVGADESMNDAIYILEENRISLLPVIENGQLTGIISDRDLKQASPSQEIIRDMDEFMDLIAKIRVRDIMTKNPHVTSPDHTIEEAAAILVNERISGLPVMDKDNQLVGIITRTDIFKMLIKFTGLSKKGIQFGLCLKDMAGAELEIKRLIDEFGGHTVSMLSTDEDVPSGYRNVYFRVYEIDRGKLSLLTEAIRKKATLLYLVDFQHNERTVYEIP